MRHLVEQVTGVRDSAIVGEPGDGLVGEGCLGISADVSLDGGDSKGACMDQRMEGEGVRERR